MGHEFSGDIVKVGSAVKSLKKNDRVAVDPSMSCGKCGYCRSGRANLCREMKYLGSAMYVPPIDGAFREYIVMPAKNCFKLPDDISYEIVMEASGAIQSLRQGFHLTKLGGTILYFTRKMHKSSILK